MMALEASASLSTVAFLSSPFWPMSLAKVLTANVRVNRMDRRLEGNMREIRTRGKSNNSREMWRWWW
jgi:hypothetical protein